MSADDWSGCPVCEELAREYCEYAKDKVPYDMMKQIESKRDHIDSEDSSSWSPKDLPEFETEDPKLQKIINWVETSIETGSPVRIDYDYGLYKNGNYSFSFEATCHNCGCEFKDEETN